MASLIGTGPAAQRRFRGDAEFSTAMLRDVHGRHVEGFGRSSETTLLIGERRELVGLRERRRVNRVRKSLLFGTDGLASV